MNCDTLSLNGIFYENYHMYVEAVLNRYLSLHLHSCKTKQVLKQQKYFCMLREMFFTDSNV